MAMQRIYTSADLARRTTRLLRLAERSATLLAEADRLERTAAVVFADVQTRLNAQTQRTKRCHAATRVP